jgi:hypothetical protein
MMITGDELIALLETKALNELGEEFYRLCQPTFEQMITPFTI